MVEMPNILLEISDISVQPSKTSVEVSIIPLSKSWTFGQNFDHFGEISDSLVKISTISVEISNI